MLGHLLNLVLILAVCFASACASTPESHRKAENGGGGGAAEISSAHYTRTELLVLGKATSAYPGKNIRVTLVTLDPGQGSAVLKIRQGKGVDIVKVKAGKAVEGIAAFGKRGLEIEEIRKDSVLLRWNMSS